MRTLAWSKDVYQVNRHIAMAAYGEQQPETINCATYEEALALATAHALTEPWRCHADIWWVEDGEIQNDWVYREAAADAKTGRVRGEIVTQHRDNRSGLYADK